MRPLRFDPLEVRPSFRSEYCQELSLPSGKKSGRYNYPIATSEIINLIKDFTTDDYEKSIAKEFCKTESEFSLWLALRLKYGITYLQPKNGWRYVSDSEYEPPKEKNPMDEFYDRIDNMGSYLFSILDSKIIELRDELKEKKFSFEDLTTPATML